MSLLLNCFLLLLLLAGIFLAPSRATNEVRAEHASMETLRSARVMLEFLAKMTNKKADILSALKFHFTPTI